MFIINVRSIDIYFPIGYRPTIKTGLAVHDYLNCQQTLRMKFEIGGITSPKIQNEKRKSSLFESFSAETYF